MTTPAIDVAVAIVRDDRGRVLMAERTARQVSAGFWELPGGKIDAGETAAQAVARELQEEVGLRAERLVAWRVHEYAFPLRRVRLHLFRVVAWSGQPHGHEGQQLAWVDPADPAVAPVLPSNLLPLAALAWPPLLPVLRLSRAADLSWPTLPWAAGLRLWLLAAPALAPTQRVQLAQRLRSAGARLLLEGSPLEALRASASGLFSPAQALNALSARPTAQLWLAGCRDETDLERARRLGADAAVVDVGGDWKRLARLAAGTPLALYAGGAAAPEDAGRALACGAAGVAAVVPIGA